MTKQSVQQDRVCQTTKQWPRLLQATYIAADQTRCSLYEPSCAAGPSGPALHRRVCAHVYGVGLREWKGA